MGGDAARRGQRELAPHAARVRGADLRRGQREAQAWAAEQHEEALRLVERAVVRAGAAHGEHARDLAVLAQQRGVVRHTRVRVVQDVICALFV